MSDLEIQYAQSDDVDIAYAVLGDGPRDVVWVAGAMTNLAVMWELPEFRRFCEQLASFSRLILFDKRGMGLSDRVEVGTLEERMDDVRAVMDAAGSERASLIGVSEGGPMSILFAATYPHRTDHSSSSARRSRRKPRTTGPGVRRRGSASMLRWERSTTAGERGAASAIFGRAGRTTPSSSSRSPGCRSRR
ncbi:MAG: alpha/beta hydrolase [Thermoleophilia bacterium]